MLGSKTLGTNVLELQCVLCWQTMIKTIRLNLINHLVGFIPCQICLYFSN